MVKELINITFWKCGKSVIDISVPEGGRVRTSIEDPFLHILHDEVGHCDRHWRTHDCAKDLLEIFPCVINPGMAIHSGDGEDCSAEAAPDLYPSTEALWSFPPQPLRPPSGEQPGGPRDSSTDEQAVSDGAYLADRSGDPGTRTLELANSALPAALWHSKHYLTSEWR